MAKTGGGSNNGQALYRMRTALGWSVEKVAVVFDVSVRTIGLYETGAQEISDARWRLFQYEVARELTQKPQQRVVAVFAADGLTPIDAVSDTNFVSLEVDDDGKHAVIASFAIDRLSQKPRMHVQRFQVAGNEHVLRAADLWTPALRLGTRSGDDVMLAMHQWLTRRALDAEATNPRLRELKDAVAVAKRDLDYADGEQDLQVKVRAMDAAVQALIDEVSGGRRV